MKITHHFGPTNDVQGVQVGLYVKVTEFRAGESIPMHQHVHSHMSGLARGWALFTVDGKSEEIHAPHLFNVESGHDHQVVALTDVTWWCIHAVDDCDETKIDEKLTS